VGSVDLEGGESGLLVGERKVKDGERKGRKGGRYLQEGFLDAGIFDELVVPEVLDQVLVGCSVAAPGHGEVVGGSRLGRMVVGCWVEEA